MAVPVQLDEIVDELEMQFDEMSSYLDRDTGKVYCLPNDLLREAEEDDEPEDTADGQDEEWDIAKRIVESDSFVRLPTKWDVHEWDILNEFAQSVEHAPTRNELLNAIHGRGAFRMFKEVLRRRRMEPEWHEFRTEALREIAIDWCKEHGIQWAGEPSKRKGFGGLSIV